MRKRWISLLLAMSLLATAAGCGSKNRSEGNAGENGAAAEMEMRKQARMALRMGMALRMEAAQAAMTLGVGWLPGTALISHPSGTR